MSGESFPSSPVDSSVESSSSAPEGSSKKKEKKNVRIPLGAVVEAEPTPAAAQSVEVPKKATPRTIGEWFGQKGAEDGSQEPKTEKVETSAPKEAEPENDASQNDESSESERTGEQPVDQSQEASADEAVETTADSPEANAAGDMTDAERQEATLRLAEVGNERIDEELTTVDPNSVAGAAAAQAKAFMSDVGKQVQQGVPLEQATAAVYQEQLSEPAPELPDLTEQMPDDELGQPMEETQSEFAPEQPLQLEHPVEPTEDEQSATGVPYATGGAGGRGGWGGRFAAGAAGWAGGLGGFNRRPGMAPAGTAAGAEQVVVNGVASGLVVGGIVGYLLGRRRGRIKTERELLPIQRKLEREVQRLSDHLAVREAQVRRVVWERAAAANQEPVQVETKVEAAPAASVRIERPAPEKKAEAPKSPAKDAEKLHLNEVLQISETIVIGSTTIRKVFETNLISERGLRRIVNEHLRGGDTRKVLTEELLIKEMSHELDPQLRDRPMEAEPVTARADQHATAMALGSEVLSHAPLVTTPADARSPITGAPAPTSSRPVSPALVVANIVALLVLAGLLITLLIVWLTR